LLVDNDIGGSDFISSEAGVVVGAFFVVPADQCFGAVGFKLSSRLEVVIEGEESVIIDSHFEPFVIYHGPEGGLLSVLIIDDLAFGRVFYKPGNSGGVLNLDGVVAFQIRYDDRCLAPIRKITFGQVTGFLIVRHVMSARVLQHRIILLELS